ncbi:MAG TPA: hypothetical protein VKM55_27730 [Candidatus Lokiarchaeia archaeon]|nr:hypothetical protein [Candidatus Lokiarchaeia archaeon]
MASWSGGVETPHAELLRKREQLMAESQQYFEDNDFEHCLEGLKTAYEISIQLKDKEAQKFVKERMQAVDKKQKNDFIEKLTGTFRNGSKGKRTQEEIMEGLTSTIEVVMNGAFALEEKITQLEERLTMREKLSEAMVEQIGGLSCTIKELKDTIVKLSTQPAIQGSQPQGSSMAPPKIPGGAACSMPPGVTPPGASSAKAPPKPPAEKKMPDTPKSMQGSLLNEMAGILAKRRKQLEE